MTDQEIEDHGAKIDQELADQVGQELQNTFAIESRERELFHAAVQAMNGLVAAGSDRGPKGIAEHAFAIADALLAEREKRQKA